MSDLWIQLLSSLVQLNIELNTWRKICIHTWASNTLCLITLELSSTRVSYTTIISVNHDKMLLPQSVHYLASCVNVKCFFPAHVSIFLGYQPNSLVMTLNWRGSGKANSPFWNVEGPAIIIGTLYNVEKRVCNEAKVSNAVKGERGGKMCNCLIRMSENNCSQLWL